MPLPIIWALSPGRTGRRPHDAKQRRLTLIAAGLAVLGVALGLVLVALRDTIVFFRSPSDIVALDIAPGTRLRLGGLVQQGSVVRTVRRTHRPAPFVSS